MRMLTYPISFCIAFYYWVSFGGDIPYQVVKSIRQIDVEALRDEGVEGLLSDFDNCIKPHGCCEVKEGDYEPWLFCWWREVGLKTAIGTNSAKNRAHLTAVLGCLIVQPWTFGLFPRKPSGLYYQRGAEVLELEPGKIVMVGDKLFNDVLGAQRAGYYGGILVNPCGTRDLPFDRWFLRQAEDIYLNWLDLRRA